MFKKYKVIAAFLIIFLLSLYPIADTDFGWHLRVGEFIFQHRIVPATDIFSFSVPNFPYVYYSWAGELVLFISYKLIGFVGPTIFYALILTVSIYFIYKSSELIFQKQYWLIYFAATPFFHILSGGRMRVFGLLYFSTIYYLLTRFLQKDSKYLFFLPPVFMLWSNFHASFLLGLGVFFILLLIKFSYPLLATFIFSILAIFINPYFYRIWQQAFTITSNEVSRLNTINPDWQSPFAHGFWGLIYFLVFTLLLFLIYKSKLPAFAKTLNIVIFILSLITERFLFALMVVFVPVANFIIFDFQKKFTKSINTKFIGLFILIFYLVLALFAVQNIIKISFAHSDFENYATYLATFSPNKKLYANWSNPAANFLIKNYSNKNILADANWGGLLLLEDKDLKLFYYGAMDNFSVNGQLFPFVYLSLINTQNDWQNVLAKYKVEVVYLPNNYPLVSALRNDAIWEITYHDDKSSILIKH